MPSEYCIEFFNLLSSASCLLVGSGSIAGIIFGVTPGITAAMAACLPLTYSLGVSEDLALLLSVYVGGMFGSLVPAVLLDSLGTTSSITTTFDGYPMSQRDEEERVLKLCSVSSFFGNIFSIIILFFFAPVLADFAIKFSYVKKCVLSFFIMSMIASLLKSVCMSVFSGLLDVLYSLVGAYDVSNGRND